MRTVIGHSSALSASSAASELTANFHTPRLILFFAPVNFFAALTRILHEKYDSCEIVGVTSHYVFTDGLVFKNQMVAVSFEEGIQAKCGVIEEIDRFPSKYKKRIEYALIQMPVKNTICLEFMTACSFNEDVVITAIESVCKEKKIPVVGGCASMPIEALPTNIKRRTKDKNDVIQKIVNKNMQNTPVIDSPTYVSLNGKVYENSCIFTFLHNETGRVRFFKESIFKPTDKYFTVTSMDFEKQTIYKLNGENALEALAKSYNCLPEDTVLLVRDYPLGRIANDDVYLTDILKINSDGSLVMNTKIYNNVKYYLCSPDNYNVITQQTISNVLRELGESSFTLVFTSIMRAMFYEQERYLDEWVHRWSTVLKPAVGFPCAGVQAYGRNLSENNVVIAFE